MADGQQLKTQRIYSGRIVKLDLDRVRYPNGREGDLEVIRHAGAAAMVPLAEDGRVLLIRQYRYAPDEWLYEVPAGTLQPGESPE
ncbi:MAG: NUDIX domain-containing protein, partial [Acidobacteriota bacterium]